MAQIELSVADEDSPALRKACARLGVTATPNPEREDSVLFEGSTESLAALIRDQFDTGNDSDVQYLVDQISN